MSWCWKFCYSQHCKHCGGSAGHIESPDSLQSLVNERNRLFVCCSKVKVLVLDGSYNCDKSCVRQIFRRYRCCRVVDNLLLQEHHICNQDSNSRVRDTQAFLDCNCHMDQSFFS